MIIHDIAFNNNNKNYEKKAGKKSIKTGETKMKRNNIVAVQRSVSANYSV